MKCKNGGNLCGFCERFTQNVANFDQFFVCLFGLLALVCINSVWIVVKGNVAESKRV